MEERLQAVERFVRDHVAHHDCSHDFSHISRVVALSVSLASEEQCPPPQVHLIHLTALIHDLPDPKYNTDPLTTLSSLTSLLHSLSYPPSDIDRLLSFLPLISFKDQLLLPSNPLPLEAAIVSDADKLDAVGAIGVARCFSYGAVRGRPLYEEGELAMSAFAPPPVIDGVKYREQQQGEQSGGVGGSSSLLHFFEKLLHLQGMMKTKAGARRAAARHQFMQTFVEQLQKECKGLS